MSKTKGFIAAIKVVSKKIGKQFANVVDDLQVAVGDDALKVMDKYALNTITKVKSQITKRKSYFTFIDKTVDENVSNKINALTDEFKAIRKGSESAKAALSKKVKQQTGITIPESSFDDVNALRDDVKNFHRKAIYEKINDDLYSELHFYGGDDRLITETAQGLGLKKESVKKMWENGNIGKFMAGLTVDDAKKLNKHLYKSVAANRKLASLQVNEVFKFSELERYSGTIQDDISRMYDVFGKTGNKAGQAACEKAHAFVTYANSLETVIDRTGKSIASVLEETTPERRLAIRNYVESQIAADIKAKPIKTKDGIFRNIEADWDNVYKNALSDDEVLLANKITNANRLTKKYEYDLYYSKDSKDLKDTLANSVNALDDIADDVILYKDIDLSTPEIGDYGINYWHVSITDEHRKTVRAAIDAKHDGINWDNTGSKQYGYQISRRSGGSEALFDAEKRLDPLDELNKYFYEFRDYNLHRIGKAYMENIRQAATIEDLLNTSKAFAKHKQKYDKSTKFMVNAIAERWDRIFARQTQPDNIVTKLLAGVADANTSAALGQSITSLTNVFVGDFSSAAVGQRMPFFNSLQPMTTTAMFKGIIPTLAALKDSPSVAKAFMKATKQNGGFKKIFSPANMEIAIKDISNNIDDPLLQKAWKDYWKYENPDVLMKQLYTMDSKIQTVYDALTTIFRLSDISSRSTAIAAAVRHAERQYGRYAPEQILKGDPKTLDNLVRNLHLWEFNSLDRKHIMEAVKKKEEFISRYATASVRSELFNYSRYFRPEIVERAKTHWATARAVRFLSWNMYYTNLLRGVHRSYINGDKEPLRNMLKLAIVWYGTASYGSGVDDKTIQSFANYGIGRTPMISPVIGTATTSYRELTGILAPSIAVMTALPLKVADILSDSASGEKSQKDFVDYAWEKNYNLLVRQPAARPFIKIYKDIFGEEK